MKKAEKGEAGYILYERFRRTVRTAVLFLIPLAALIAAALYFGTRKNAVTVIAMVGMVPACMSVVSVIMMFTIRPVAAQRLARIREKAGSLTMAYELYFTNYDKNVLADALAVCGKYVVVLSDFRSPDRNEAAKHLTNLLRAAGFSAEVNVMGDEEKFLERLDSLNAHASTLRQGMKRRNDERYPEEDPEQQMLHVLRSAAL